MKIWLDVDGVVLGWWERFCALTGTPIITKTWEPEFKLDWNSIIANKEHWSNLPVMHRPEDIPFEFEGFMTSAPKQRAEERIADLRNAGFNHPVIFAHNKSKKLDEVGADFIVDDKPTFKDPRVIYFMPWYARWEPPGLFVTHLNQVPGVIELKKRFGVGGLD